MDIFWRKGFEATSIRDLIEMTGANRFGLYGEFGDKRNLFLKSLAHYAETFVSKAFAPVEASDAGIEGIETYFRTLIDLAEAWGMPGRGCLMANSMTEVAPHDEAISSAVRAHFDRLCRGFERALAIAKAKRQLPENFDAAAFAQFLAISAQGLWAYSRISRDASELRRYVTTLLAPITPRDPQPPK